ncbi:MAG: putative CGCGG family rSAM target protein [Natronomonas sp.]|jgi:putative CGCGG family rSAM target protein|uniref:CGCGG family putative rSAM-modified RiPP protein n=1 Tax=Natronomonas sp. TaxID=2184060 RepID=UPI003989239A
MTTARDSIEPVTDRIHDTSWSANLEKPAYADNEDAVVEGAIEAVEHTAAGTHVNLVTHGDHGHPSGYLYLTLEERFGHTIEYEHIDQCGCGGHVTKVTVDREP